MSVVATSTFNTRGQFNHPRVLIASVDDFTIEAAAPSDPFNVATVDLAKLGHHFPRVPTDHRIRVNGAVTQSQSDGRLTVQQGRIGVRVQALEAGGVRPGDRVEIAGFIDRSRDFASLKAAVVRKVGTGSPPEPIVVTPREIIEVLVAAIDTGEMAQPGDYDGCLIQCSGQVGDIQRSAAGILITLLADEIPLEVLIDRHLLPLPQSVEPGCWLSATGVLEINLQPPFERLATDSDSEAKRVQRLTLLPRSAADLVVTKPAPWWNAQRLAIAAAALACVLLAAVAWVGLLRRRVAIETARATREVRRRHDAEIEFEASIRERNRLAANLHDTLLQTLGGAGFQLDTCRRAVARDDLADTSSHLDVARRMLKHAASELRGSVWALRTTPLAGRSFAESLEGIVGHLQQGQPARINLDVTGRAFELPDFVAGNLLLVTQEAIRNALHHAEPRVVRVVVAFDDASRTLSLTVHDDGYGFDMVAAAGPTQGHFGIQGMRERIGSLGGTFAIESELGRGTAVSAHLSGVDAAHPGDTGQSPSRL
jgi:signal transduction histidine kinase